MSNSENSAEINQVEVLDQLIKQVRAAHGAAQKAESLTLDSAMDAGDALFAIQERITIPMKRFMAENMSDIGKSTWKLYLRLSRHRAEIEAAREQTPLLSISKARRLITKKKPKLEEKSEGEEAELTAALNAAKQWSDAVWTKALTELPFERFLSVMPGSYRERLQVRAGNQAIKQLQSKYPNKQVRGLRPEHLRLAFDATNSIQH
jgi:hypothetical protein